MSEDTKMWAIHILGPDEIYAAPSREVADAAALVLNNQIDRNPALRELHASVAVIEWPWGYESWSAEKDELRFEAMPIPPTTQQAGEPKE